MSAPEPASDAVIRAEMDRWYRDEVRKRWHRPRFYRHRVADPRWFAPMFNRYPHHKIGAGVVVGSWAYCVKWASL